MSRRNVRGSRNYKAESDGFKELGRSAWMSSECLDAAYRLADEATIEGHGSYVALPTIVHGGRNNEERAGAKVIVTDPDWRDSRDRTLLTVTKAMTERYRDD